MSRSVAVAAYVAALAAPASANWQAVATGLFDCLPKARGVTVEAGAPAWWADYKLGKQFRFESMEVLFHDGESVRVTVASAPSKLRLIPSAVRGAIGFYRARNGQNVAVPAFASLTMVDSGQTYDADVATRLTAELRAVPGTVQGKPMTAERVAWMERETGRRIAFLRRMRRTWSAHEGKPVGLEFQRSMVRGAIEDLRRMRAALSAQRGGMVEAILPVMAPVPAPEAVAPVVARPIPVAAPMDPEAVQAAWCEAVTDGYAAPAAWEVTGTDPEAEAAPAEVRSETVIPVATTTILASPDNDLTHDSTVATTTPSEAIAAPIPSEAIAATVSDLAPDLSSEAWEPTAESHPIIALALSDKARAALFDAVMDGTFPAEGNAKAGAWRVTLADALALQGLDSIRWVGMPRKAYTRRVAPVVTPAEAIHLTTPAEAIPNMPHPAYIPGAGRIPSPVTFHSAP